MIRLPRWIHQTIAFILGYFWLPCPRCGRMFGGHEWQAASFPSMPDPAGRPGISKGICTSCVQVDIGDKRHGTSAALTPDLARQAAAALNAAADAADAEMQHWRDVVDRQRSELLAAAHRDALARAGLDGKEAS